MVTRALPLAEEPAIKTFFHKGTNSNRTVAKFGIAPDFGSGGRGFESHRLMVPCQLNKGTDSKFTEYLRG